ncbi:MAG: extracellular solute-binding protein [Candidatus Pacebacteria bacterium]|nr:extracellular solute-binding protein [Candidatus Paceibacterota bacterium]
MTKFQIIVLAIFIVAIIGGAIAFATYKSGQSTTLPAVTMWGTLPADTISKYVQEINLARSQQLQVNYVQIDPTNFNTTFINALASGSGPDVVLLPQDLLARYTGKIVPIPYNVLTERDFLDTYVGGAQLYLGTQGVLAIPLLIDPMVMYWNRDVFTNAGIATYPQYWDEFPGLVPKLTQIDTNSNIDRSAVALGEFANVPHAREIFGSLLLQLSNPVSVTTSGGLASALGNSSAYQGENSTTQVLDFFTEFANPTSKYYSWNRALPSADSDFLSGDLAVYFGYASEINQLRAKNPNLNFDAAPLPQVRGGSMRAVYGTIYGLSVVKSSANPTNSYNTIQILTNPSNLSTLVSLAYLPPARRDMIAAGTTDPYLSIFYSEALITKSWQDIDPSQSSDIFQAMVQSVTSGAKSDHQAITDADNQYNLSLQSQ